MSNEQSKLIDETLAYKNTPLSNDEDKMFVKHWIEHFENIPFDSFKEEFSKSYILTYSSSTIVASSMKRKVSLMAAVGVSKFGMKFVNFVKLTDWDKLVREELRIHEEGIFAHLKKAHAN